MATSKPFQLIAGHPALDLVNTLDHRYRGAETETEENLNTYDDLLRFLAQSRLLSESKARKLKRLQSIPAERAQVLQQVIAMRETLAAIAYALLDRREIPEESLASLEGHIQQAFAHRRLIA